MLIRTNIFGRSDLPLDDLQRKRLKKVDSIKKHVARGCGQFPLCIYVRNFKHLLFLNQWSELKLILAEIAFR